MTTITFYSYKGGVGRTLTLANLGRLLTQLRKRVFVLDLDLEAPGLHYKFGIEPTSGVLDCLTTTLESRAFPPSLSPYVVEVDGTHGLHLMAAGQAPSLAYWRRLSRLNWHDLLFGESAPGLPFFLELKQQILKQYSPDYLLIDSRTGITEIGGVATQRQVDLKISQPKVLVGRRAVEIAPYALI